MMSRWWFQYFSDGLKPPTRCHFTLQITHQHIHTYPTFDGKKMEHHGLKFVRAGARGGDMLCDSQEGINITVSSVFFVGGDGWKLGSQLVFISICNNIYI